MGIDCELVYIAGTGRNGSTLLGQCLSCHPDVLFAGELTHIWLRGFIENQLCGCGIPFRECEFWRSVAQGLETSIGLDWTRVSRLRDSVSPLRKLPRLLLGSAAIQDGEREYCAIYSELVESLAKTSQRSIVIDSSKYPTDLSVLLRGQVRLKVIHLVRDCNAVVFAWKKWKLRQEIHWQTQFMPRYSVWRTAVAWRVFNTMIPRIARKFGAVCTLVRYEDFVNEFPDSVGRIHAQLGIRTVEPAMQFFSAHNVSGNPCRFDFDPGQIRLDEQWKKEASSLDRMIVRMLCGRQQHRFGYQPAAAQA